MKLHKEGFATLSIGAMAYAMFNLGMWRMFASVSPEIHWILFGVSTVILFIMFFLFRARTNVKPFDTTKIVSPAYGRIVGIEQSKENEYFQEERLKVTIRTSLWNIHCNYVPMNGEVKYHQHKIAKPSGLNEHSTLVLENNSTALLIRQIAGKSNYKVTPYITIIGRQVLQNEEMGFIKYGAQVEIFFPKNTQLKVIEGDKVIGGKTVLADLV